MQHFIASILTLFALAYIALAGLWIDVPRPLEHSHVLGQACKNFTVHWDYDKNYSQQGSNRLSLVISSKFDQTRDQYFELPSDKYQVTPNSFSATDHQVQVLLKNDAGIYNILLKSANNWLASRDIVVKDC